MRDIELYRYVAEERTRASLEQYLEQFPVAERAAITAIAMDMWAPYEEAVRAQVPQADDKIVFDLFHIMQHMNEAVDRTRRREQRELKAAGDDHLTGTKYLRSYGEENVPDKHRDRLARLTARGMMRKLKTTRAWSIKEGLRDPGKCRSRVEAEKHWRWWYSWAIRSQLSPVKKVATMLRTLWGIASRNHATFPTSLTLPATRFQSGFAHSQRAFLTHTNPRRASIGVLFCLLCVLGRLQPSHMAWRGLQMNCRATVSRELSSWWSPVPSAPTGG
jgi:hypothetical protein